jgi:integrase
VTVYKDKQRGSFYFVVDLPRGPDGRRNQRKGRGFATERAAKLAEAKVVTAAAGGRATKPGRITFGAYLVERWLPALRADPKRKPSTINGYAQMVPHLVAGLGHVPLSDVTGDRLTALYGQLRAAGKAERTVRYVHTTAHLALKDAVRWRLIGFNPAEDADAPAQTPPRPKAWTPEQVATFLEHAADDRWWPLWRLAATTGMRRGELAGLRWCDLDLDGGALVVAENRVVVEHEVVTGTPKGNRSRRIGLDAVTVEVLRGWRRRQLEERLVIGELWPDIDLVFVWPDGSPLHPDVISRTYRRIAERGGLPPMPLHNLRHAWATAALLGRVDVKVVSARLGHSSTRITHDIYTAAVPSMDDAAAELVAGMYDGAAR